MSRTEKINEYRRKAFADMLRRKTGLAIPITTAEELRRFFEEGDEAVRAGQTTWDEYTDRLAARLNK